MAEPIVERVEVAAPEWTFTMNAYIVRDPETGAAAIVDPGAEAERLVEAAGGQVQAIWVTHGHFDHVSAVEAVRRLTSTPVLAHALDAGMVPGGADIPVEGGDVVTLGNLAVRVLFVPGHTPGHVGFLVGKHLLGGDLLFPGGPGHTESPEAFRQLLDGLEAQLFTLDDDVAVHPGHGEPVTIGQAKREYAGFRQRSDTEGVYGDVTWAGAA